MTTTRKLAAATAVLISLGSTALAAGDHGHGSQGARGQGTSNHDMKQMMMRMHAHMMGSGGHMSSMGMMGDGASLMSIAKDLFDTDGDGKITSQEAREGLQTLLAEYDADGDEALSLSEFETLHSALVRETMVDRFQFLDDDGDGAVSASEIVKPADMMKHKEMMHHDMMPGNKGGMHGTGGMMGTPGQGGTGSN
ncbi:EF-hand domain-containing protein [Ruegeria marina]|uniref:EF hand n=1 Tax=Ruegeria marina TaxID=639004 RepID=A0A1G6I5Q5_9RHOB|nr:calcium-binding protein [Ruegeria marina]SDC01375.1 EF hand [Ruegeria marina]